MTVRTDPEGHETDALFDLVDLEGAHVLEIGAGDGRLTWRYAYRCARVTAVEPSEASVVRANERLHGKGSAVEFHQAAFEDFAAARAPGVFDVALLSWSLCCMQPEGRVYALEEIHRLLKPAGALIEIDPVADAPAFVEVRSNGQLSFSEEDPVFDYEEEDLRHVDAAVESVLQAGLFVLEERRRFELRTHATSVKEMRDHWTFVGGYDSEEPEEKLVRRRNEMYARAAAALDAASGVSDLVYVEPAQMSRLVPRARGHDG